MAPGRKRHLKLLKTVLVGWCGLLWQEVEKYIVCSFHLVGRCSAVAWARVLNQAWRHRWRILPMVGRMHLCYRQSSVMELAVASGMFDLRHKVPARRGSWPFEKEREMEI